MWEEAKLDSIQAALGHTETHSVSYSKKKKRGDSLSMALSSKKLAPPLISRIKADYIKGLRVSTPWDVGEDVETGVDKHMVGRSYHSLTMAFFL